MFVCANVPHPPPPHANIAKQGPVIPFATKGKAALVGIFCRRFALERVDKPLVHFVRRCHSGIRVHLSVGVGEASLLVDELRRVLTSYTPPYVECHVGKVVAVLCLGAAFAARRHGLSTRRIPGAAGTSCKPIRVRADQASSTTTLLALVRSGRQAVYRERHLCRECSPVLPLHLDPRGLPINVRVCRQNLVETIRIEAVVR